MSITDMDPLNYKLRFQCEKELLIASYYISQSQNREQQQWLESNRAFLQKIKGRMESEQ